MSVFSSLWNCSLSPWAWYSKYDYKNKETDNSRNGHSSKRLRTSFGEVDVSVPRDRKGEFAPQVLKKRFLELKENGGAA